MRWPVQNRKAYYAKVAEERGDAAARQLVAAVSTEWRRIGGDRLGQLSDMESIAHVRADDVLINSGMVYSGA